MVLRLICAIFALIAVLAVGVGAYQSRRAEITLRNLQRHGKQMVYESVLEAQRQFRIDSNSAVDVNRMVQAGIAGRLSLTMLGLSTEQEQGLYAYFHDLIRFADGAHLPQLIEYTERLSRHLTTRIGSDGEIEDGLPRYDGGSGSGDRDHSISGIDRHRAMELARIAFGGNIPLPSVTAELNDRYLFLLENAYCAVSKQGRVLELKRVAEIGTETPISAEQAAACAREVLMRLGYDGLRLNTEKAEMQRGVWLIAIQFGQIEMTAEISGAGVLCGLYEKEQDLP